MFEQTSPRVKRLVQDVGISAGKVTANRRATPTFLIAGAQRSGTTSMFRALAQHPAILSPRLRVKGVHYFDTAYWRGEAWYRGHFPTLGRLERAARRLGGESHTFESSPYYLCHPLAAERLANDLAGVKVLVLIRDPVERAYSAHAHELARGFETLPFEAALDREQQRLHGEAERMVREPSYNSHSHQHHAYVERGHYVEYLRRLEKLVGRDRIHVVDSHQFFAEPEVEVRAVLDFLGLKPHRGIAYERHNARPRNPLPDRLRARLDAHFLPWDEDLAEWLGRPPSWRA